MFLLYACNIEMDESAMRMTICVENVVNSNIKKTALFCTAKNKHFLVMIDMRACMWGWSDWWKIDREKETKCKEKKILDMNILNNSGIGFNMDQKLVCKYNSCSKRAAHKHKRTHTHICNLCDQLSEFERCASISQIKYSYRAKMPITTCMSCLSSYDIRHFPSPPVYRRDCVCVGLFLIRLTCNKSSGFILSIC